MEFPGVYKISKLAEAAGITPNLLRTWERRYQLLSPVRQSGNQRLYSESDLLVVKRVRDLLHCGLGIGEVAALGRENLLKVDTPQTDAPRALAKLPAALEASLLALAPVDLVSHRESRFGGEDLGVSLRSLDPADISTLHRTYTVVKGLYEIWTYMERRLVPEIVASRLRPLREPELLQKISLLGAATNSRDWLVAAALKDARQGALGLLLERCRCLEDKGREDYLLMLTLARDHAKMMRNAFYDLDEPLREADESLQAHDLTPILNKVACLLGKSNVASSFAGSMTCRCLETSMLDRVLYNFIPRSACAQDSSLWVILLKGGLSRWVFELPEAEFKALTVHDLSTAAVALAVGVSPLEALSSDYLGYRREAGKVRAWFHWPTFANSHGIPRCECDPLSSL